MKSRSASFSYFLLLSSIVLLPACTPLDWIKDKLGLKRVPDIVAVSSEKILATVDGKPFMTTDEFEKKYDAFIQGHPLGRQIAAMPGIKRKIFEGLVTQKLISKYVTDHNLDKTPEYQEQLENIKQMINIRAFEGQHPVKVSDAEMRSFYDQNKDKIPEFIVSQGGVKAAGVSFTTEADAKAFLEKARGKGAELSKVAAENGLTDKYQDYKVVNRYSIGIEPVLRDKVLSLTKFPTLEVLKGDSKYYVVYAGIKEEPKVRTFEEAKPMIEQRLMAQKQEEANQKALEDLKKENKLVLKEEYFVEQEAAPVNSEEAETKAQFEKVMAEEKSQETAATKKGKSAAKAA